MEEQTAVGPQPPVLEPELAGSAAWKRLEDQVAWYDAKSAGNQRWFKALKVGQIVVAALVPVLAAADASGAVLGALGAVVLILESFQQLFQFQQNWITYRSTCEALKHEKFLFLAGAGPYGRAQRPESLLSERVEGLVSQEHAKWTTAQEERRSHEEPGE